MSGGPPSFGTPRIAYPVTSASVNFTLSPSLLGRYSAGPGAGEEIALGIFSVAGGTLTAQAASQYDLIGRRTAGAGAMEISTRTQMSLPGLEQNNTFTGTLNLFTTSIEVQGNGIVDVTSTRYAAATGGPRFQGRKARGTIAAPLIVSTLDNIVNVRGMAYDGATFVNVANFSFLVIEPVPSPAALGVRFEMSFAAVGSIAGTTDAFAVDHTNGFYLFGTTTANVVIRQNRGFVRRPLTFGTLPAAAVSTDTFFTITDGAATPVWGAAAAGGGATRTPVWSNGVAWLNG